MKTASTDLFDLIKMMSASEKRYFQQYAQRHTDKQNNQYLLLFNAIASMQIYNEDSLKNEFKNTKLISHFAVTKRYLQEQILDSLHHYHLNQGIEEKLLKDLHLSKILLEKKLIQQAEKRIQKIAKRIEQFQLWTYSPLLIQLERKLLRAKRYYHQESLEKSHQFLTQQLKALEQENFYWLKSQQIIGFHLQKVKLQNQEQEVELEAVVQELQKAGIPQNPKTQIDYLKALATYHFMKGEIKVAAKYNQELLKLFEQKAYLMELEKEQYIASFNNYLIDSHILGNYAALEKGIQELRKLTKEKLFKSIPNIEVKVLELTYSLQLNARIKQNQFGTALELLPDLQQITKKHKDKIAINYRLSFLYLMAYIYYRNGDYSASLEQLDVLRNNPDKKLMQELQYAADRLLLINHLALDNHLLLDNLVDNVRRAHRQKKINSKLEAVLFKGIKKICSAQNHKKQLKLFEQMKTKLLALKATELRAWNYFDFDLWELG